MTTSTEIPRPLVQAILDSVDAYIQEFCPPLAPTFLRPVFATVLSTLEQGTLAPEQTTALIQTALQEFNPRVALQKTPSPQAAAIATPVNRHLKSFKPGLEVIQVLDILDAYIQQTQAPLCPSFLYPVVVAMIPHLPFLNVDEGQTIQLANQVMLTFHLEEVATKLVDPNLGAMATQLISKIPSLHPEQAVLGILKSVESSLLPSMDPTEAVLYHLAQAFLSQMIDLPLPGKPLEQFAMQVTVKFGGNRASSTSPEQFAQTLSSHLAQEVDRFRTQRAKTLIPTDATRPTLFGDLQVGITLKQQT